MVRSTSTNRRKPESRSWARLSSGKLLDLLVKFAIILNRHTMDSLYRHRYGVEL